LYGYPAGRWENHGLNLLDVAPAVRYADGSFTLKGDRLPVAPNILRHTATSFLAGLALGAPPMTAGAVGDRLGEFDGCAVAAGSSDDFVRPEEPQDGRDSKRTRPPGLLDPRAGSRDGGRQVVPPGCAAVQRGV
jgi:hypothetical protein